MVKLLFGLLLLLNSSLLLAQETITVTKRLWIDSTQSWTEPDQITRFYYDNNQLVKAEVSSYLRDSANRQLAVYASAQNVQPHYSLGYCVGRIGPSYLCLKTQDVLFLQYTRGKLNNDGSAELPPFSETAALTDGKVTSTYIGWGSKGFRYSSRGDLLFESHWPPSQSGDEPYSFEYIPYFDAWGRVVSTAQYASINQRTPSRSDSEVYTYAENGSLLRTVSHGSTYPPYRYLTIDYNGWYRFDTAFQPGVELTLLGGSKYLDAIRHIYSVKGSDTTLTQKDRVIRVFDVDGRLILDSIQRDGSTSSISASFYPEGDRFKTSHLERDSSGVITLHIDHIDSIVYFSGNQISTTIFSDIDRLLGVYRSRSRLDFEYGTANIKAPESSDRISIYPNPATHSISFTNSGKPGIAEIWNALGQCAYKGEITAVVNRWSIGDLQAGLYWLKLPDGTVASFVKN